MNGKPILAQSVARNAHLHRYSERMDAEIMLSWTLAMRRGAKPADILRTINSLHLPAERLEALP